MKKNLAELKRELSTLHGGTKGLIALSAVGLALKPTRMSAEQVKAAMDARGLKYKTGDEELVKYWLGSTDHEDRGGDVVDQAGWVLKDYQRNSIICWSHDYYVPSIANSIAETVVTVGPNNKALQFALIFADKSIYPFGGMIHDLVDAGFIKASSVGFLPMDWENRTDGKKQFLGYKYTQQDLWELSICNIPANQDALKLAIKSMDGMGVERKNSRELVEHAFLKDAEWDANYKTVESLLHDEESKTIVPVGKGLSQKTSGTKLTRIDYKRLRSIQRQVGYVLRDAEELPDDPNNPEDGDDQEVDPGADKGSKPPRKKTQDEDLEIKELLAVLEKGVGASNQKPAKKSGGDLADAYLH